MCSRLNCLWAAFLLTFLAGLPGCGGGHYESQFEASVTDLRNKTGFNDVSELRVVDLPNTEMTIRLPKIYTENETHAAAALDAQSADPRDETLPLSPERLQPLGLELPGHIRTYESFVNVERVAEPLAVYCILASVPASQTKPALLREQILAKYGPHKDEKAHRNEPVEWQQLQIRTPDGEQVEWWKLRVSMGAQRFHFYEWEEGPEKGKVKSLVEPSYYEIYLHEGDKENVIVAWRTTQSAATGLGLPDVFQASIGTVEFEKPEDQAAGT